MADPRRVSSRRAALSYNHLRELTNQSGALWPDLLLKDYQGILQDSYFTFDEIDALELRIEDLESRVSELEAKELKVKFVTESEGAQVYRIHICKNTTPITLTLPVSAEVDQRLHIKRTNAVVNIIGLIDDTQDITLNVNNYSLHLVFDGDGWRTI